jgi:FkbM family methyltransferase
MSLEDQVRLLIQTGIKKIPENIKKIKIDVGVHKGKISKNWLLKENDLFVFGFEPHSECVEKIKKKIIDQEIPDRLSLIPYAVDNCEIKYSNFFWTTGYTGCSSLLEPNDNLFRVIKRGTEIKKIITINLKLFFDIFPWDKFEYIEYLKIDAQGKDIDILKSAGDYLKEKVVYVTAEAENSQYNGSRNNNKNNIIIYMKSLNFIPINHNNTTDPTFINKKFIHLKDKIYIFQD